MNYDLNKVSVFTTVNAHAGYYTVYLIQTFKEFPDVHPFVHFKVTILPEKIDTSTKKQPPYFKPALHSFEVTQCPNQMIEMWTYTLPEIVDPQNSAVNV